MLLLILAGLALEYLGDPVKTAERFLELDLSLAAEADDAPRVPHRARVYRTGDGARVRLDGQLEILGRIDSTVKVRGFKVGLPFVEGVIQECEGVALVVVRRFVILLPGLPHVILIALRQALVLYQDYHMLF